MADTDSSQTDPPADHGELLSGLQKGLADLTETVRNLVEDRDDRGEQEQGEPAEGKPNLEALAASLGISPAALKQAASEARKADDRQRFRPLFDEFIAELREADEKAKEEAGTGTKKPPPKESGRPAAGGDSSPVSEHWTGKRISDLIR